MARREKLMVIILALLAAVMLSAATVYGYMSAKPPENAGVVQKNPLQEIKDLETKASENSQNPDVLESLANAYFDYASTLREGQNPQSTSFFAKAAETYARVLQLSPKRVGVQTDMGTALYYSGQADQAETAYKKAIEIDPAYLNGRLNYGIFLIYQKQDFAAARQQLTAALQLNPTAEYRDKIRELLAQTAEGPVPDYQKDIEPIIFQGCTSCHGPGGVMAKAPLHNYFYVMRYVSPGNPNSPLLEKMKNGHPVKQKQETLSIIERWINAGAPATR